MGDVNDSLGFWFDIQMEQLATMGWLNVKKSNLQFDNWKNAHEYFLQIQTGLFFW